MGFFSALFGPKAPSQPAPGMRLLRYFNSTSVPPTDYTVLDLETSGLDACTCEILEIGAIKYRNHIETNRYHTFVRPKGSIPKEASRVNHITWSMVCKAPYLSDIAANFFDFLGKDIIVGYNIAFDMKFLQTRFEKSISNSAFDVLSFVKEVKLQLPRYRLDDLRGHFALGGIPHTALGDCEATAKIFQKCLETPAGLAVKSEALALELEYKRQNELEQARRQKIKDKKTEAKKSAPPTSELNLISSKMQGTTDDYFSKVKEIIAIDGKLPSDLNSNRSMYEREFLSIKWHSFFGIKLNGRLKYIILNIPPETVSCDFVCTPTSMQEGEDSVRIYVSRPEDLEGIKEYIIASMNRAIELNGN